MDAAAHDSVEWAHKDIPRLPDAGPAMSSRRQLRPFQRRNVTLQPWPEIAVRAARQQPHLAEFAQIPPWRARDEAVVVAGHVVPAGEHLQERDAFEHLADAVQAGTDLRRFQVVEYVGAHDQVETGIEAQLLQLAEARQTHVAAA